MAMGSPRFYGFGHRRRRTRLRSPRTGWCRRGIRTPDRASRPRRPLRSRRSPARWLLELLHLPAESGVGFVTGGTMREPRVPRSRRVTPCCAARARIPLRGPPAGARASASSRATPSTPRWCWPVGSRASERRPRWAQMTRGGSTSAASSGALAEGRAAGHRRAAGGRRALRAPSTTSRRRSTVAHACRRLGARRRRVRSVGGGEPAPASPRRGAGRRRLVGDRRAQDAQRALRLRRRDRARRARR